LSRIGEIQRRLVEAGAGSFVVTHLPNIFYLCGFAGSAAALLIRRRGAILFTDGRYTIQAREEVCGARVHIAHRSLLKEVGEEIRRAGKGQVAFEPAHLTIAQMQQLQSRARRGTRWVAWEGVIEKLRTVKTADEIALVRAAAQLASDVFEELLPLIKPGVRELDLAAEIEYRMRRKGASGPSFSTIVASGPRSALPHARASSKPLKKNELVVFDLGAILRAYCSDMTRTIFIGRASARIRRWYRAVVEAQEAAREVMSVGVQASSVDAAARAVLERYGLGRHFTHSTGHGLGLEVHESPRLGRGETDRLRAGNVVTVEPGVYIEGVGGIRVEDDVAILARGTEVLTRATRNFLEL
jgi:Xaa-Pro aminopeptidase